MLKKYLNGNALKFNIDFNSQLPKALSSIPNISLSSTSLTPPSIPNPADKFKFLNTNVNAKHYLGQLGSELIDYGSQVLSDGLFGDDSEVGRAVGGAMSGTLGSVGNTLLDNFIKGNTLYEGLGKNAISGASGALGGLAASQVGKGVTSIMGDSKLGRFTGGAASSALGQILGGGVGNPINFASNTLGAGLSAMTGPSKEYGGKYGNVTQTMDAIYGTALGVVGMMGPVGAAISAGMALNKGLSNIFGSTSGMTKQDAILGSAFMPAPVKWLNMWGSSKTGTFDNLSWQNSEKANSFMGNAFGNLSDKFDKAREEAGKTYGTFSQGAKREALRNIDFANYAWDKVLAMADLNELQKIRSLYMTSINNLRYAQNIQGGWSPLAIGKQGMKIFNNATNHNIGMRLLSAAALIDNKQMILSFLGGGTPRYLKYKKPTGGAKKFRALTQEELENRTPEIIVTPVIQRTPEELNEEWERTHPNGGNADPNLSRVSDLTSEVFNLTTKPPFTGQEYLEAAEAQRQKKIDKFHEAEKIAEATMMADLAVSAAPLLLRGFRWVFDKAGNLIRVPIQRTNLFLTSPYTGKWTRFGNREYRFRPGYLGMNGTPVESRVIKITPENAVSITPEQWTAAQDAAIVRGDIAEAQRLRDLHAKVKGYNSSLPLYHGSPEKNITAFDPNAKAGTLEGSGGTTFFTPNFGAADTYAKGKGVFEMTHDPGKVYKVYSAHKNPKIIDYDGASYHGTGTKLTMNAGDGIMRRILNPKGGGHFLDDYTVYTYDKLPIEGLEYPRYYAPPRNKHIVWEKEKVAGSTSEEAAKAMSEGYDVAILKNVDEGVGPNSAKIGPIDDYAIRDPRLMKLADAVTYDNNGIRIPLGKRDNFKLNDIRYGWLPWFLGGSTAATLYNTNK